MNKELEVLENIKSNCGYYYYKQDDFNFIETELKEKEKQDEILRIIKEKRVDLHTLLHSCDLETYINHKWSDCKKLTQAEFDLLKEWLK